MSDTWLNVSTESNPLGAYTTRSEHIDFGGFGGVANNLRRSFHDHRPLLVPPKYSSTPLDIITDLNGPYGVDITRHGLLLVSEFCGHRISSWDLKSGKKVNTIGAPGKSHGEFCFPAGITLTPNDTILVADCYNDRIQELTLDGQCLNTVGKLGGAGPLLFDKPRGICFSSQGLVCVADRYNHRVQVLNPDLTYSHSLGGFGMHTGQFNTPYDIAFDAQGYVYITDCGNNRVHKFTSGGRIVSMFGTEGKKPGELSGPAGITIEDGIVYVTEYLSGRVSMFTTQGHFVDVKVPKKLKDPYGVKCNPSNRQLLLTDFSRNRLIILDRRS